MIRYQLNEGASDFLDQRRLYQRYQIDFQDLAAVKSPFGQGHMSEIGYGGFSAFLGGPRRLDATASIRQEKPFTIDCNFLGAVHTFDCRLSFTLDDRFGFCFLHRQSRDLHFLKENLGWIEVGKELSERDLLQIQAEEILPPTEDDLEESDSTRAKTAKFDINEDEATGQLNSASVFLMDGKVSYGVKFSRKKSPSGENIVRIRTLHSVHPGAINGELRETQNLDYDILRRVGLIGIGLYSNEPSDSLSELISLICERTAKNRFRGAGDLRLTR